MRIGIFHIIEDNPELAAAVRQALERCDFPWQRCLPYLRQQRVDAIPVSHTDRFHGAWAGPKRGILISRRDIDAMAHIFLLEAGHAIDTCTLSDSQRADLHTLFHGGHEPKDAWKIGTAHNERAHEAFMYAFVNAFAGGTHQSYGLHVVRDVDAIREIVLRRPIVPFTDIEGHTHRDAIEWAAGQGLLEGRPDGTVGPNEPVTRGQLASILKRYHERNAA